MVLCAFCSKVAPTQQLYIIDIHNMVIVVSGSSEHGVIAGSVGPANQGVERW